MLFPSCGRDSSGPSGTGPSSGSGKSDGLLITKATIDAGTVRAGTFGNADHYKLNVEVCNKGQTALELDFGENLGQELVRERVKTRESRKALLKGPTFGEKYKKEVERDQPELFRPYPWTLGLEAKYGRPGQKVPGPNAKWKRTATLYAWKPGKDWEPGAPRKMTVEPGAFASFSILLPQDDVPMFGTALTHRVFLLDSEGDCRDEKIVDR